MWSVCRDREVECRSGPRILSYTIICDYTAHFGEFEKFQSFYVEPVNQTFFEIELPRTESR